MQTRKPETTFEFPGADGISHDPGDEAKSLIGQFVQDAVDLCDGRTEVGLEHQPRDTRIGDAELERPAHERSQPSFAARDRVDDLLQLFLTRRVMVLNQRLKQVRLVAEVVVQRGLCDAGGMDDVTNAGGCVRGGAYSIVECSNVRVPFFLPDPANAP